VIAEALYPKGHPYSWTTIGSLADLDAATLQDVRQFHKRWYSPNNATLVIAGDFDPVQARRWVEKYFGDIPRGAPAARPQPRPAVLAATKRLVHEDAFAPLPLLTLAWPAAPAFHADGPALEVLFDLLTDGQDAPLNQVLVEEQKLTDEVGLSWNDAQMAGEAYLTVRAFDGVDLDQVKTAIDEGMRRFERRGVDAAALQRVKAVREAAFYSSIESVLGKASRLAQYDAFLGRPDFVDTELARLRGVSAADVQRVYRRYLKDKPFVAASFVPKGKPDLALAGSQRARVVEEPIVQGAEAAVDPSAGRATAPAVRTASSFDRSAEPAAGPSPVIKAPTPWTASLPTASPCPGSRTARCRWRGSKSPSTAAACATTRASPARPTWSRACSPAAPRGAPAWSLRTRSRRSAPRWWSASITSGWWSPDARSRATSRPPWRWCRRCCCSRGGIRASWRWSSRRRSPPFSRTAPIQAPSPSRCSPAWPTGKAMCWRAIPGARRLRSEH
jgi:hypothetical protein